MTKIGSQATVFYLMQNYSGCHRVLQRLLPVASLSVEVNTVPEWATIHLDGDRLDGEYLEGERLVGVRLHGDHFGGERLDGVLVAALDISLRSLVGGECSSSLPCPTSTFLLL